MLPVAALMLGLALLVTGSGLLGSLLALRGALEGFDAATLGWIMSAYFLGFVAGTWLAPPLAARLGHIRSFSFCAAAASAAVLLHPILVDPFAWAVLRFVTGAALVCLYAVIESWLGAQGSPEQRGQLFAGYMMVNLLSLALGQALLPLGPIEGFALFSLVALLTCVALMPVTWTRLPQPPLSAPQPLPLGQLWQQAPSAAATALLSGVVMGAFWGLMPVFANATGLDAGGVAEVMAITILGGALLQWPLGRVSDRIDRRQMLAVLALFGGVIAVLLALLHDHPLLRGGLLFAYGGLAFTLYPVAVAHLMDRLEPGQLLAGSGRVLLLYGVGATLGPLLAGSLMSRFGAASLFALSATVLVALGLFVAWRLRQRARATDHPGHFLPMVRTSGTALEMIPEPEPGAEGAPPARM
ncbi:MFS transporter [Pseudomarimonas salicorniae]|uniref:MFS transporter n=1 Tax=Pseudomarimonas salicorniae TaxID=2933270 RepID=A0ABT0GDZ0_9GAMM|nr:MFS transporter [Lysobacter sp. CAU 1642]MCK7592741.1 MFS transporter [Lysobacter sp. CAU 1642]